MGGGGGGRHRKREKRQKGLLRNVGIKDLQGIYFKGLDTCGVYLQENRLNGTSPLEDSNARTCTGTIIHKVTV